jgi:biopolymer transport protein ExbD
VKKLQHQEVEVQITPMLDMAFQLLSFFILTYHPAPVEGQFSMNLLPASPAIKMDAQAPPNPNAKDDPTPSPLRTITTQLRANPDGSLGLVTLEELEVTGMDALREKLKEILNPANKVDFEQALIQADPNLKYEEVMKVIDIYSGLKINKISFGELDARTAL